MISEDNVVNGYVNLRVAVPHFMSPTCQVWWSYTFQLWRHNVFSSWNVRFHMLSDIRHYSYKAWDVMLSRKKQTKFHNVDKAIWHVMLISTIHVIRTSSSNGKKNAETNLPQKKKIEDNCKFKAFCVTLKRSYTALNCIDLQCI